MTTCTHNMCTMCSMLLAASSRANMLHVMISTMIAKPRDKRIMKSYQQADKGLPTHHMLGSYIRATITRHVTNMTVLPAGACRANTSLRALFTAKTTTPGRTPTGPIGPLPLITAIMTCMAWHTMLLLRKVFAEAKRKGLTLQHHHRMVQSGTSGPWPGRQRSVAAAATTAHLSAARRCWAASVL